jgi:hypothetical protein
MGMACDGFLSRVSGIQRASTKIERFVPFHLCIVWERDGVK